MRARVSETTRATSATPIDGKPGRFLIQLISPGWGSSGYYSESVLKAAGAAGVFPKGTHMYLDHPGRSEEFDRPERTVRDLASVLDENARWDADLGALVAEANVFAPFRPLLDPAEGGIGDAIGVSIRAFAESEPGEAEGRKGQLVTELVEGISVDYVTHAGRGGKILEVIESARQRLAEAVSDTAWSTFSDSDYTDEQYRRACVLDRGADFSDNVKERFGLRVREPEGALNRNGVHAAAQRLGSVKNASDDAKRKAARKLVGMYRNQLAEDPPSSLLSAAGMSEAAEASANDLRAMLDAAVVDAYGADQVWAYVIDWDESAGTVWFCQNTPESRTTYAQSYTSDGSTVTLDGSPTEVRPVTTYVPVGESGEPTTEEDGTMPQIEESELSRLRESDRRVIEAERERDAERTAREAAETERDQLREAEARRDRASTVSRIFRESLDAHQGVDVDDYQRRGIMADAVIADGTVDEAATRAAFDRAFDRLAEGSGRARVRLGGRASESHVGDEGEELTGSFDDLDALAESAFDADAAGAALVGGE